MGKASAAAVLGLVGKVILVARNAEKLSVAKNELITHSGCDEALVEVEVCDCLSAPSVEAFFAKRE